MGLLWLGRLMPCLFSESGDYYALQKTFLQLNFLWTWYSLFISISIFILIQLSLNLVFMQQLGREIMLNQLLSMKYKQIKLNPKEVSASIGINYTQSGPTESININRSNLVSTLEIASP